MTKFEDVSDPGFIAIAGELGRWVRALDAPDEAQANSATTTQQQREEQQRNGICM